MTVRQEHLAYKKKVPKAFLTYSHTVVSKINETVAYLAQFFTKTKNLGSLFCHSILNEIVPLMCCNFSHCLL
jgi:hypothetical protein